MFNIDRRLGHKLDKSGGDITGDLSVSGSVDVGSISATSLTVAGVDITSALNTIFPIGSLVPFAGSSAPSSGVFLLCDGSAVSRTTYASLFSVIGTTYGSGDGSTTFNLPNTNGIFLRGAGSQAISGVTYSGTLANKQGDQMQGHLHYAGGFGLGAGTGASATYNLVTNYANRQYDRDVSSPISDGTNGTPRTGTETRPANMSVNYLIRCR